MNDDNLNPDIYDEADMADELSPEEQLSRVMMDGSGEREPYAHLRFVADMGQCPRGGA